MKSWLAGGFNSKVISRVMEIANSRKVSPDKLKIYVTGMPLTIFAGTAGACGLLCVCWCNQRSSEQPELPMHSLLTLANCRGFALSITQT